MQRTRDREGKVILTPNRILSASHSITAGDGLNLQRWSRGHGR